MNNLFYRFSKLIDFLPLGIISKLTNQKTIYPFYHIISDKDVIHIKHLYKIRNTKEFEKDLDFLLKNFVPIDINNLIENIFGKKKFERPSFLLSFDDGLSEFYDIVAPILLQKGVPAINFLNSGFIDNKDMFFRYKLSVIIEKLRNTNISKALWQNVKLWFEQKGLKFDEHFSSLFCIKYGEKHLLDELALILEIDFREYLQKYKPYMNSDQINSLIQQGFSFGAHGIDHPNYGEMGIDQQINQTKTSIEYVTTNFGLKNKFFSFPFTDYNVSKNFFELIFNDKMPLADITFGCAGLKKDEFFRNIQRIPMEIEQFTAKEIVYGEFFYYMFKALLNKNITKRI